ncbi:MAG: APC family permease [Acidobacteria bacterium]|nr:APC family permease [Acidobacteriota bacterium]
MSFWDKLLGRPIATSEEASERLGVLTGIPSFGLDALGSAAYGPEAALTILIPIGLAGVERLFPLSIAIAALLVLVSLSYRQVIEAFPDGGGAYTVASHMLGRRISLLAAAALALDYLLNVSVGISTGVGALVSAVPQLQPYTLALCLSILLLLTVVNLRGARETGFVLTLPTYLFLFCMFTVVIVGLVHAVANGGHPVANGPYRHAAPYTGAVTVWLLLRAFASGCTALTGVEAVSNGVTAFREPRARTAQRTLMCIVSMLAVLLLGAAYLVRAYGIAATDPGRPGYQSLLSSITSAVMGRGFFYGVTIISILALLSCSANTSFAGFPQLCRTLSEDDLLPRFFGARGRRLVYTDGIVTLSVLAAILLIVFGGVTDRLIPLFAIGAFIAFTLSQAGMVRFWQKERARWKLTLNLIGCIATGMTACVMLVAKFIEGAWMSVLIIGALMMLMHAIRKHYAKVAKSAELDHIVLQPNSLPMLAVVPVSHWDRASMAALQFAYSITKDVEVLHIDCPGEDTEVGSDEIETMLHHAEIPPGMVAPKVVTVCSPYRFVIEPIVEYVLKAERENPGRRVAVVVPELVSHGWYHYLLHNYRTTALKARLLLEGNRRIVVINTPWYFSESKAA